jgi:hypothetical protein
MERIRAISLFPSISASALAEFKQVAADLLERTQQEPGTLEYEWYFNSDETQCIVHESFVDSDAVLVHIGNAGDLSGRIVELGGGVRLEVLGDPSDDLRAALAGFGAPVFAYDRGK